MNLRQFRTLVEFLQTRSFAAAGDRLGLSHSAVSIQMQQLEQELGATLFDRSSRPPTLTQDGAAVAEIAGNILDQIDHMKQLVGGREIPAKISIGIVPTALSKILPRLLGRLRDAFPTMQIGIKSGLSGELAAAVAARELHFALITAPTVNIEDLVITELAREPLYVVGPQSLRHITSDAALASALPFIAFNKRAWLGQQIEAQLKSRSIVVTPTMEVDSLDAIEALVAEGFGVSILPQRLLAASLSDRLTRIPFGDPIQVRRLVLIQNARASHTRLEQTVQQIFSSMAK